MVKKIIKKIKREDSEEAEKLRSTRITNETVAEHREQILAGGRKFKYPLQYERHRLLINSLVVLLIAIIFTIVLLWWQLYIAQNTGNFFYRISQLLPISVAKVDTQPVPYSDYLMEYRSSLHWLQQKSKGFSTNSKDSKKQAEHVKRQSLDSAIENAYAQKVADKLGVSVSEDEINSFIDQTIQNISNSRNVSRQSYEAVLSDSFGVSPEEYRSMVKHALIKQKVSFAVDKEAKTRIQNAQKAIMGGMTFEDAVLNYSTDEIDKTTKGDVGFVPINNQDQGLAKAASKLQVNEISGIIKGSDSYYIIKLLDKSGDQVHYARLKVGLTEFDKDLRKVKQQGKVEEYIKVDKDA